MTDVSAHLTRTEIDLVVRLLGVTPVDEDNPVWIRNPVVDGICDEPLTLGRSFRAAQDYQANEDFDAEEHEDLFVVIDEANGEAWPIESFDPEADRKTAQGIVTYLTERFNL